MRHDSWNLTGPKEPAEGRKAQDLLSEEFDAWAEAGRGESMERGHLPTAGQVLARIPFDSVQVFLDLGTGNGYAVRHAAARMPPDGVAVGLDVSPRMVEQAKEATAAWAERERRRGIDVADVQFVEAPFDAIPLPAGAVDVVFSNEAIYYAPDVGAALRAVVDVLRPGGRFHCGLDYFVENRYSHDWAEKVGVPMVLDSESGWRRRFEEAGFVAVHTERVLDPGPADPSDDLDAASRAAFVAWKNEVGTLVVSGTKA